MTQASALAAAAHSEAPNPVSALAAAAFQAKPAKTLKDAVSWRSSVRLTRGSRRTTARTSAGSRSNAAKRTSKTGETRHPDGLSLGIEFE